MDYPTNREQVRRELGHAPEDVFESFDREAFAAASLGQVHAARLHEEFDYVHEARSMARFRKLFRDDDEIVIPRAFPQYSSRRVLTMSRLDGYSITDIARPGVDRSLKDWLALKYCRTVFRQILEFGVLHTRIALRARLFKKPGHAVFLMRALLGLDAYVQQLGTVTNWHRVLTVCLDAAGV
jgi:predicted unusual protein kinase regulating ubiquinone biosynthesis (AarF/ABC1/UbiB family)